MRAATEAANFLSERFLWALPTTALVQGELLRTMRRFGPYALTWGAASLLALFFASAWPELEITAIGMGQHARDLVSMFFIGIQVGGAILLTGLAAANFVSERESNTYEMLALTLLRPFHIVAGKLINILGLFFLFTMACMPILAAVFFLTGLEWAEVAVPAALTTTAAASWAMTGLFVSAYSRNMTRAVALSYVLMLFLNGGWALMAAIVMQSVPVVLGGRGMEIGLTTACPPVITFVWLNGGLGAPDIVAAIAYQLVVALSFLALVLMRLRRPFASSVTRAPEGREGVFRRTGPPVPPIADGDNPIHARELRWGSMGRRAVRGRLTAAAVASAVIFSAVGAGTGAAWGDEDFALTALAASQIGMVLIIAPALGAGALTRERERGNLDALRMTLLTPRQVIFGYWTAGMSIYVQMLVSLVAGSLIVLPFSWHDGHLLWVLAALPFILIAMAMLSLSIGIKTSTENKSTSYAIVKTYVLCGLVFFGGAVAATVGRYLFASVLYHVEQYSTWSHIVDTLFLLSPVLAFVSYWSGQLGAPAEWLPMNAYWAVSVLLASVLSLAILLYAWGWYAAYGVQDK